MLKDTPANRWSVRVVIVLLQGYGPFCLAYMVLVLAAKFWHPLSLGHDQFMNSTILWALWTPEALFYLFLVGYSFYVQLEAVHPPIRTKDERLALFSKVLSEIYDPASFLCGWFRGSRVEEIGKEELRKFLNWAFWEGRAEHGESEDRAEIEGYVQKIEKLMPTAFQEGPGKAKGLRLTVDPIEIEPRSLLWYCLIMAADTLAMCLLMRQGLHYYRRSILGSAAIFPPRPAALFARHMSVAPSFSYFLRKHTSKTRLPIIHFHGIGVGLISHVAYLDELHKALNIGASADDQVGILSIEVLQISSRLTSSIPRRAKFIAEMTSIVNHHFGSSRFVLVAHSYGSVLSTQILNDPHLSPRVSGALLIDPVTILLHMPDVAFNFTVRRPVRANEWELWYFASKDPQIAHTLGRHFFWSENVLWRDQIDKLIVSHNLRFTASLASDDLIVNTNAVRAYLADRDIPDPVLVEDVLGRKEMQLRTHLDDSAPEKAKVWQGSGLEILWWDGYDHADVFDKAKDRAKLVDVVKEYVKGA